MRHLSAVARLAAASIVSAGLATECLAAASPRCDGPDKPSPFEAAEAPAGEGALAATFSPDGATLVFSQQGDKAARIVISRRTKGGWSKPKVAPFSGVWRDLDPAMAPDGAFLVFSSNRPGVAGRPALDAVSFAGKVNPGMGAQLWRVDRTRRGGWGAPWRLPDAVNDGTRIYSPSVAADGSVYFQKPDPVSRTYHIYRSPFRNGRYGTPEPVAIGPGGADERDPAVAPDESFLVFSANYGVRGAANRLYLAFRTGSGWGAPIDLGDAVNRPGAEGPHLGPDRCTIYYDADGRLWRASLGRHLAVQTVGSRAARSVGRPLQPELFAPERVWPAGTDTAPAFTPDGATLFFTHAEGAKRTIMTSRQQDGAWSAPAPAPFSGTWRDIEPAMSPDGRYLVFISNRPAAPGGPPLDGYFGGQARPGQGGALWRVDRRADGWGDPVRLPDIVNSDPATYSPAVAADGSLYFNRPDPVTRVSHIYRARAEGGGFGAPERLPIGEGATADFDAAVAPDQSFLIFSSPRAPAPAGRAILFATYRRGDGWTPPAPLGSKIEGYEARLGPDRQTLYFSAEVSDQGGDAGENRIFRIPLAGLIDRQPR